MNPNAESPAWHADVLRERVEAVKSGKEKFIDWEAVKKQLRGISGRRSPKKPKA
jgi:Putative addiction module component